jgi:hypothetical protein
MQITADYTHMVDQIVMLHRQAPKRPGGLLYRQVAIRMLDILMAIPDERVRLCVVMDVAVEIGRQNSQQAVRWSNHVRELIFHYKPPSVLTTGPNRD